MLGFLQEVALESDKPVSPSESLISNRTLNEPYVLSKIQFLQAKGREPVLPGALGVRWLVWGLGS